jgi:ribosomal protein S20
MTLAESAKTKIEAQWDIIDDKKARAIYYEVLNIEEELKSKLSYLKDPLAEYFNKYIDLAKEKISEATATIKKLEEKGIIVKDRAQRVDELKLAELQKLELEAAQPKKVEAPKIEVKKVQELGLVQKIYNFVVSSIAKAYNFILNIFSKKTVAQKTSPVTKQEAQTGLTPTQTPNAGLNMSVAGGISTPPLGNTPTPVMVQNAPITMPLAEEIPTSIPER